MELYTYYRSSCSYRVRIALNLKGVSYVQKPVHLVKNGGEQHQPSYIKLNPMRIVPTLIDQGLELTQSMAIIEYLDKKYPEPRLFADDLTQASKIREICEIINSGIQPIQNLSVITKLGDDHDFSAEDKKAWMVHWIERGFKALEQKLVKSAGTFCYADQLSAADCFLIPQVYNANRFGIDMEHFPTIFRIDKMCKENSAFKDAAPENQADCPD